MWTRTGYSMNSNKPKLTKAYISVLWNLWLSPHYFNLFWWLFTGKISNNLLYYVNFRFSQKGHNFFFKIYQLFWHYCRSKHQQVWDFKNFVAIFQILNFHQFTTWPKCVLFTALSWTSALRAPFQYKKESFWNSKCNKELFVPFIAALLIILAKLEKLWMDFGICTLSYWQL